MRLTSLPQVLFAILEGLFTEDGHTFVEVFDREDDSRATCQSVDFSAAIAQTSQKLLNKANFLDNVKVSQFVNILQQS